MRFDTGIHPRQWHRGAWLLAFLIAALGLLLTHRPTGGVAYAMQAPDPASTPQDPASPTEEAPAPPNSTSGFVSEIVDSSYSVGPAEFFALDLPTKSGNARAVHLFGTVATKGKKDIIVRLFRAADYDLWLKQKSGRKPQAFFTSERSSSLTLDQDLPAGPVVLLLDNGYSIRTPKKVICQLQIRYERNPTETFDTEAGKIAGSVTGKGDLPEDNLPTPRSNSDQELPPPPPPPPSGY
jgi:hypothetical protein